MISSIPPIRQKYGDFEDKKCVKHPVYSNLRRI